MYDEGNTDMPIGSSVGFTDDGMSTGFNPGNTNGMSTGFNPGNTNGMSTGFNPGNTNGMFTGTDVNTDFTDGMFPSSSAGFTNGIPTGGFGSTNRFATTRDPGNNFTDGNNRNLMFFLSSETWSPMQKPSHTKGSPCVLQ